MVWPLTDPAVTIRKRNDPARYGSWAWRCNNINCGWVGVGLGSQQAALREACRHLIDAFHDHHDMVESSAYWSEERQRGTATCQCGYAAEEKSENGAEERIEDHIDNLRQQLPPPPAIRESSSRPRHADGTPYRFAQIVAEGWGFCDGCMTWSTATLEQPHQCAVEPRVLASGEKA